MEGGAVRHNFERDPPRDHHCQVWFNLVQWFLRRRFKCDLLSKYALHNRYKSAERKISQKYLAWISRKKLFAQFLLRFKEISQLRFF
jgi:hypothetical protein